jgi:hypothetical protein
MLFIDFSAYKAYIIIYRIVLCYSDIPIVKLKRKAFKRAV